MKTKILRRLRPKVKLQRDFYVFDTETGVIEDDKIHYKLGASPDRFIFGVIYGYNYTKIIKDLEDFKKTLLDERFKNRYVFAHNLEYDLGVLYSNVYDMDPEAIFNGKLISATNGNCRFADSLNIFRTSVRRLGEMLGKDKKQLGNHQMVSKLKGGEIPSKDINYCIRDCEIVWDALFMIFEEASDIKITQASLSMTYYRRFFQPFDIQHNEYNKFFWGSYYGGRTEAFRIGHTNAVMIDVNSMYPDQMRNIKFPNPKYLKQELNIPVKWFLQRYINHYEGCARIKVKHRDNWIGFLPYRSKGKLCFPVGEFEGWYNFNEIRFALEHDVIEIDKVYCAVYAEPMESPFKDYVDTLYLKRYEVDNAFHVYRIKVYMNSLYGKFAQKIETNYIYLDNVADHIELIQEHQRKKTFVKLDVFNATRKDAFLVVKNTKNFDLSYSIPSFASYITSGARIKLLKELLKLEQNRPVYCDTDSIAYEIDTPGMYGQNKKLGEWSIEDKVITEVRGLKNYSFIKDEKMHQKIKGIPQKATQTGPNTFEYMNLVRTKEALRRNIDAGQEVKRTKVLSGKYDKRIVLENGETKPITL
jgi:hypothetical protein